MVKFLSSLLVLLSGCISITSGGSHYFGAELSSKQNAVGIYPMVGAATVREDNTYVFAGARYNCFDYPLSLSLAAGHYDNESLNLGSSLEFRTTVEWVLTEHWRIGYIHMSNAGLGNINPGFDVFGVTVSW